MKTLEEGKGKRSWKMTEDVQKRLISAITAGNYYEAAAAFAGVAYSTLARWMQIGKTAKSGKYREFYEAVIQAEAEAEVRIVAQWQKQIPDNWAAARDFLARRHPSRWGNKEKINAEISGKENAPIKLKFDFSDLPSEILRSLAEESDEGDESGNSGTGSD